MDNEPPDPGGTVPSVGHNITINESSMDTDSSLCRSERKRARAPRKMCKHCNKRRRNSHSTAGINKDTHCHCDNDSVVTYTPIISSDVTKSVLINQEATPRPVDGPHTEIPSNSDLPQKAPQVARALYEATDLSPYVVHIQKIFDTENSAQTLHPITLGHFLKKRRYNNIINGSLKRIGRNRISLSFSRYIDANSFINDPCLTKEKLKAFVPSINVCRIGIIKGVPTEWSPEEIMENVSVPTGCGKVIKARRLNYKVHEPTPVWKPSQTVVLTFDGQILPKRVFCCYNSMPVELYTFPTIQCFNCCRFGHTKVQCRSNPHCFKCGEKHSAETCSIEDECDSKCCHCGGIHYAINKKCPEFERQKAIKHYMAHSCVSYAEASQLHPPISKLYADVVTSAPLASHINKNSFSSQSSPVSPNTPIMTSQRKTVFLKPRDPPKTSKGYDRVAHQALINNEVSMSGNGVALQNNINNNESQILNIIIMLINTLSKNNNIEPSNVATVIDTLSNLFNLNLNGPKSTQDSPVEQSQHCE